MLALVGLTERRIGMVQIARIYKHSDGRRYVLLATGGYSGVYDTFVDARRAMSQYMRERATRNRNAQRQTLDSNRA